MIATRADGRAIRRREAGKKLLARIWRFRFMYFLLLPGFAYFIVYKYLPMFGLVVAFQDYSAFRGFFRSEWVGFDNFKLIFEGSDLGRVLFNTLYLNFMQLGLAFPAGIVLALLLNEVRHEFFKKTVQTVVYLPHFVSWIVVVGLVFTLLSSDGIVNSALKLLGLPTINFLTSDAWFMPLIVLENIWKESGWSSILFLAAIAGINPNLYEAAAMDGAKRWQKIWYITLPGIRGTIVILLILQLGNILNTGIEQIFLMVSSLTRDVGTTLDLYVFQKGIEKADYSFATAFGLFKSVVGLVLILAANRLAKRFGEDGVF
ncbi:sugar ABC transporter permease [Paenibacillus antri]|uniref:Sugar ABC transporter permease n=1 Tax=Paenibacillus antri TaxID=2582848 RepID=A0A5R9GGB4_9BACL|nr:ABC transporter permease subunit [Paenibacillus antri]TLS52428.1 sugar ABC transporter permease [Paenibacillus antri]